MSVSGPIGGFYQSAYRTSYPNQPFNQTGCLPTYCSPQQLIPTEPQRTETISSKVSVGKFAKLGAAMAAGFGVLRLIGYVLFKESVRQALKEMPGVTILATGGGLGLAAIGGAINAALLGWLYNKTQKKG